MNNVRTVSDTKRTFYNLHTRPINTIYRRVVEELMVEMHLLSVNIDFSYNPIYALGVVTTFDRFMEGYQPERDRESIFNALCQAIQQDPQRYRQDAERLRSIAQGLPVKDLIAWLSQTSNLDRDADLQAQLQAIANNSNFKYNRLFAIGVFSLLELSDAELVKDEKRLTEALKAIAAGLHLSDDKFSKDLELYRSNLDKMAQALIVMADMLSADRKKREQRKQQSTTQVAPPTSNE
ncbi:MAG: photosystem II biogenesis protein Psp29 [Nostoc sp. SerVER01]|nr:photosystem II biogenesis protein Psp29 [Nostoc sp. SerVER01]MDZ8025150.1 photosystem II biogenesis protein Psp29 [Nostoc sp. DedQUE11]MDZ8072132.1 photosystem II biogenesis protein Psp29 [Nostoc sp. DedQUE01]MDZ8080805.1 photosystem II biogenesis protein Psp29 [Nostoc sp. DcaGUA01]